MKKGASTLWDNMDGTGEHYTKWNKADGERQIPYDLTYLELNQQSKEVSKI